MLNKLIDEEWRTVSETDGWYLVSSTGRVLSVQSQRLLTPDMTAGYCRVTIGGVHKLVHRLVALEFLANPESRPQVNHKNGIKGDNRVCNLEWATAMENITHSRATGLVPPPAVGVCVGSAKLTEENVIDICKLVRDGVLSERKIGAMFGVGQATIHKIKHGERWSHLEAVRDNVNFLSERWVRLTEAQQKEIAALYESGTVSQRHLAAKYGVSQPTIQKAIRVWASKIAR